MSIEDEIDHLAEVIRTRAPGWAEEDITVENVNAIEAFLIGEVQALAGDIRLLLAAKGKPSRKFSFDLVVAPRAPVVAVAPAPAHPAPSAPRPKFQGRLVGTKEPVLAVEVETPSLKTPVLSAAEEAKIIAADVGFISD